MSAQDRNQSIDLIKIIATLMVMMLHVNVIRGWNGFVQFPVFYALPCIAIPLFFMVSGYLLIDKLPSASYCSKKIWSIIKISLILCIFFDILKYIQSGLFDPSFPLCFIQKGKLWVLWYFGASIIIYSLLPILIKIANSSKFITCICILFVISSIFFVLNFWDFERKYVIQTFRIWYWIFYFFLGAWTKKHSQARVFSNPLTLVLIIPLYCTFQTHTQVRGNEYFFGSLPCIIYAFSLFQIISKVKIPNSVVIRELSKTFLPVYTLHVFLIQILLSFSFWKNFENEIGSTLSFFVQYTTSTILCFLFGYCIMRISLFRKIFSI